MPPSQLEGRSQGTAVSSGLVDAQPQKIAEIDSVKNARSSLELFIESKVSLSESRSARLADDSGGDTQVPSTAVIGGFEPRSFRGPLYAAVGGKMLEDFKNEFGLLDRTDFCRKCLCGEGGICVRF